MWEGFLSLQGPCGPWNDVLSTSRSDLSFLLQGQRGRASAACPEMEEGDAEGGGGPVAVREGFGGGGGTSTNHLLASVKEQVGDAAVPPSSLLLVVV